jgi:hypothetical protein
MVSKSRLPIETIAAVGRVAAGASARPSTVISRITPPLPGGTLAMDARSPIALRRSSRRR